MATLSVNSKSPAKIRKHEMKLIESLLSSSFIMQLEDSKERGYAGADSGLDQQKLISKSGRCYLEWGNLGDQ